jgi:GLPGLI family protein
MVPGSNDVIYNDFPQEIRVEQRELGTKQYIIQDSIRRYNWKIGNEAKTILGYTCKKATSQRTQESFRVEMDNGVMKRTAVTDTLLVVAWFTDAIPSFGGPDVYQGQVPGTILEIDVNNGRTSYLALEITAKADLKEIKEPKGKKITVEEFAKEREKMMKEMEENSGGNFQMRIRN